MFKEKNDYYLFHPALTAWNSLRLKGSMRSDYMSVPTIACTTHFWSGRMRRLQELIAETLGVGMQIDSK